MKRKILLVLGLLLLIGLGYLYYQNKKIEGIWIHHYSTDKTDGNYSYAGNTVLNIDNQSFNSYSHFANGGLVKQNYFNYGQTISFWPRDTMYRTNFGIKKYDGDSIVFETYSNNLIFKKVPDSLANRKDFEFDLKNKAFEFRTKKNTDTIFFDPNYIFWRRTDHPNFKWTSAGWEKTKIEGFDFILNASWTSFIVKENLGGLFLYAFDNENELSKVELKEIELDSTNIKSHYCPVKDWLIFR